MKKMMVAGIALASMLPFALPSHAAKCSRVSAQGIAVTNVLASTNAKMGVSEAIAAKGMKAKGKIAMKCKYDVIVSTCTATQSACK
jgi:hypothetical protein